MDFRIIELFVIELHLVLDGSIYLDVIISDFFKILKFHSKQITSYKISQFSATAMIRQQSKIVCRLKNYRKKTYMQKKETLCLNWSKTDEKIRCIRLLVLQAGI